MEAALGDLLDEAAITQTLARYARGIDRLDYELIRSCYHPDAVEDRGRFRGGLDEFIQWLEQSLPAMESTWHLLGVPLIELEGDVAWVETYCLGVQRTRPKAGEPDVVRYIPCRYCDRFERRDGRWLIARRVAVYEPASTGVAEPESLGLDSRRDRADAAYLRD